MADSDQNTSHLMALAPELRNRIYRLVLVKSIAIRPQVDGDLEEEQNALALLQTCRQIRNEATAIYYAENTFRFYDTQGKRTKKSTQNPGGFYLGDWLRGMSIANLAICEHLSIQGCIPHPKNPNPNHCRIRLDVNLKRQTVVASTSTLCCGLPVDFSVVDGDSTLGEVVNGLRQYIEHVPIARLQIHHIIAMRAALSSYMLCVFSQYHEPIRDGAETLDDC